jgi:acyl-CoA thioesterase-1
MSTRLARTYILWVGILGGLLAAAPAAAEAPATLLFLGDSLTAGYELDEEQSFPALIREKIAEAGLNAKVINAGVSGDTTAGGLRRLDWLLRAPVDVLFVALGGNDGLRGIDPEVTRQNLRGIIEKTRARHPRCRIVLAGMQVPPNLGEPYAGTFRRLFPELAREQGVILMPFLLEAVAARPELNLPDGIHPNAAGQRVVAGHVWSVVRPLLDDAPGLTR